MSTIAHSFVAAAILRRYVEANGITSRWHHRKVRDWDTYWCPLTNKEDRQFYSATIASAVDMLSSFDFCAQSWGTARSYCVARTARTNHLTVANTMHLYIEDNQPYLLETFHWEPVRDDVGYPACVELHTTPIGIAVRVTALSLQECIVTLMETWTRGHPGESNSSIYESTLLAHIGDVIETGLYGVKVAHNKVICGMERYLNKDVYQQSQQADLPVYFELLDRLKDGEELEDMSFNTDVALFYVAKLPWWHKLLLKVPKRNTNVRIEVHDCFVAPHNNTEFWKYLSYSDDLSIAAKEPFHMSF